MQEKDFNFSFSELRYSGRYSRIKLKKNWPKFDKLNEMKKSQEVFAAVPRRRRRGCSEAP